MVRAPWRIVVFALIALSIFLYFSFHSHYDPLWFEHVGIPKELKTNKPTQQQQQQVQQQQQQRANTMKPQQGQNAQQQVLPGPGFPIPNVHYVADYNISALVEPYPFNPALTLRFKYFDCNPPTCYVLSNRPRICWFPRFFSDDEADQLVKAASTRMGRSEVALYKEHKDGEKSVQDVRTSTQAWLDPGQTPVVATLRQRLIALTGLDDGELLQILHYDIGQKYDAHNDYFDPAFYGPQSSNRAITNFLYLNTVEEGGETWFPRANGGPQPRDFVSCDVGLKVKPTKGSMAIFYDMTAQGELDPHSLHGACPVKKGEKWGGTQWLRVPT